MKYDPGVFKAYDIRGIYPDSLNEELAFDLGRAMVTFLGNKGPIVVGRDVRLSSQPLSEALIAAVRSSGADAVDIGMCSSDQFYFSVAEYGYAGGIIITASHNPPRYNGFKLVRQKSIPISGDTGINEIRNIIETGAFAPETGSRGALIRKNTTGDFVARVRSLCDVAALAPLKVVMDAANGTAGPVIPLIFQGSPIKIVPLFFEPDGSFPNHEANPLIEENRAELERTVLRENADLGMAWDGDADRFFCVDDKARFVPGDFMTAILVEEVLGPLPEGQKVIYDLRASRAVRDAILRHKGVPIMNRVGHSFIKQRMRDEGAVFAGEVSGHYYFSDFFKVDTGMVPALYLLRYLTRADKPLSEAVRWLRERYNISGEINRRAADPMAAIDRIEAVFSGAPKRYRIDGLTVEFDDWWFNLRPSNTEPLLRLNLEADSAAKLREKTDYMLGLMGGEPA